MTLKPKQVLAASLIAQGRRCKEVAEIVGVTPQTISEWKKYPSFEALVNTIKLEALEGARAQLQSLAHDAVATLEKVMLQGSSDALRLKAVEIILSHVGLTHGTTTLWRWGVGPISATDVAQERASAEQEKLFLAKMMNSLG